MRLRICFKELRFQIVFVKAVLMFASHTFRLLLTLVLWSSSIGQSQSTISVTLFPPESTLYVGQVQSFTAIVVGTNAAVIEWTVLEPNGGTITQEGIDTAPQEIGIYHVLATAAGNGAALSQVLRSQESFTTTFRR